MKKLSLLINLTCLFFLVVSCQNTQKVNSNTMHATVTIDQDSASGADSSKIKMQTPSSGSIGTNDSLLIDTSKIQSANRAIKHAAPEQQKIDSIKKAKAKSKF